VASPAAPPWPADPEAGLAPRLPTLPPRLAVRGRYAFAFQPIVDVRARRVVSYEALVRGAGGEPAWQVLDPLRQDERHAFDADSREVAVAQAAALGIACDLNLNLLPRSLLASCAPIETTLGAAQRHGLPIDRLVIEVTEGEEGVGAAEA
jgi:EAL domain-containing protein (putative c-di-GMP-specific phosphodiesterase class I)